MKLCKYCIQLCILKAEYIQTICSTTYLLCHHQLLFAYLLCIEAYPTASAGMWRWVMRWFQLMGQRLRVLPRTTPLRIRGRGHRESFCAQAHTVRRESWPSCQPALCSLRVMSSSPARRSGTLPFAARSGQKTAFGYNCAPEVQRNKLPQPICQN